MQREPTAEPGRRADGMPRLAALAAVTFLLLLVGVVGDRALLRRETPPGPAGPLADGFLGDELERGPIAPLPRGPVERGPRVQLGRRLFHDARLSGDGSVSCATCHDLAAGGDDGLSVSPGVGGRLGTRNSPTVLNSGFSFRQFWDGRAETLEEQVDGPLTNPVEMASSWERVLGVLRGDAAYVSAFATAYGGSPTPERVRDALAAFQRELVTPAPFDRWLWGESDALSPEARRGWEVFQELGCVSCHQGVNVGGNMFQRFGALREEPFDGADPGRFEATGDERDRGLFKVPGLRNVELTAPYFHDGSAATLEEAIRTMAEVQLLRELTDEQVTLVAAFLRSLTGPLPEGLGAPEGEER